MWLFVTLLPTLRYSAGMRKPLPYCCKGLPQSNAIERSFMFNALKMNVLPRKPAELLPTNAS